MEEIYDKMLKAEIEELVGDMMPASGSTMTIYDGEKGLLTLLTSIRILSDGYAVVMSNIDHDHMISILTSIKEVEIPHSYKLCAHRDREEFESLDIKHLEGYVTFHKNGLYSLNIRGLSYPIIRKVMAILFGL